MNRLLFLCVKVIQRYGYYKRLELRAKYVVSTASREFSGTLPRANANHASSSILNQPQIGAQIKFHPYIKPCPPRVQLQLQHRPLTPVREIILRFIGSVVRHLTRFLNFYSHGCLTKGGFARFKKS